MLNTSANKAVYGGAVPAATGIAIETIKWFFPETATLFTDGYVIALTTVLTAAVVWLVPNKETTNATT